MVGIIDETARRLLELGRVIIKVYWEIHSFPKRKLKWLEEKNIQVISQTKSKTLLPV